jgi:proline iminopeptidase
MCILRQVTFTICIAVLCGCASRPLHSTNLNATEGYIKSKDGVQLHYQIIGSGIDTVVVLHGGPGFDKSYLAPDLEPLGKSYVVIFYDQRGSGKSTLVTDSAIINIDAHIADLEAVRQHFSIRKLSLIGHSWGALLAARFALNYPEEVHKMIFLNPGPLRRTPYMQLLTPNVTRWMDSISLVELRNLRAARQDSTINVQVSCRNFWKLFIRGYYFDPFDTTLIQKMRGDFCSASATAIRNLSLVNSLTWASIGEYDWRDSFRSLIIPVLIIAGQKDIFPLEAFNEWKEAFPGSSLLIIKGTGHYSHVEKPELVFDAITKFLH